jgi:hypothetical protein
MSQYIPHLITAIGVPLGSLIVLAIYHFDL